MIVHWAHIDSNGNIVTWGSAKEEDVELQPLAPGLTRVARPPDANPWDGWKYTNDVWIIEQE